MECGCPPTWLGCWARGSGWAGKEWLRRVGWQEIGTAIGAALAAIGASWGLVRPVKKRLAEAEAAASSPAGLSRISERVTRLEDAEERRSSTERENRERLQRIEERLGRTVTDEEFAAYTQQTTKALNGLSEKVGRVTGALEAWTKR